MSRPQWLMSEMDHMAFAFIDKTTAHAEPPTVTYEQMEMEIKSYLDDYTEVYSDTPDYMEVGEKFGIHHDELPQVQRLIQTYEMGRF